MSWSVTFSKSAAKQTEKLPASVRLSLKLLVLEMAASGPIRGNWKNYSKLGNGLHHCHLKKGQPTYVAVWQITDKVIKLVEVQYVGTHEKAPY